jgi:hypothetical protein
MSSGSSAAAMAKYLKALSPIKDKNLQRQKMLNAKKFAAKENAECAARVMTMKARALQAAYSQKRKKVKKKPTHMTNRYLRSTSQIKNRVTIGLTS